MSVSQLKDKVRKAIEDRVDQLGEARFSESELQKLAGVEDILPGDFGLFIRGNKQLGNIRLDLMGQDNWVAFMDPPPIWPKVMMLLKKNASAIGEVSGSWASIREELDLPDGADVFLMFNRMKYSFGQYMPDNNGFWLTLQ